MVFFTTLLAIALATRYFPVVDFDSSPGALAFRIVMLAGHSSAVACLLMAPVLALALAWPRPRWLVAIGAAWSGLILLALLVDTQVFQLYRFHINAGVLNLLFGGAALETFVFSGEMYAQACAIAVFVLLTTGTIAVVLWRRVSTRAPKRRRTAAILAAMIASFLGFHATHIWADVLAHEPILEQTSVLPLRYAATAKRFLRAQGVEVRAKPAFALKADRDHTALSYPLQPLECTPAAAPLNVIFIVVDSWRFDEMSARVTPNIEAFARSSVRFAEHSSGGNATRIGMFSLFYSIPGTYWHPMLNERRGPVFIDELLRQGYDVEVFRSAPLYSPEFDRTIFANVTAPRLTSEGGGPAARDADLTSDFLAFLGERQETAPFFALLFYDAPHSFDAPADYPEVFSPAVKGVNYLELRGDLDKTPYLNRYRNSLHYVDSLVGRVLDALRDRALLERSVVVITGDHGQEFNDTGRNYWGHGSNFTRHQIGVPLVIRTPGLAPGVVRHRTSHFDVAPTLLRDTLGCSGPPESYSVGRSLFEAGGRDPLVVSEYADFAIVRPDQIAVVRKHGLKVLGPDYAPIESSLDPRITRAALEQKTRFYKALRLAQREP
jgi:membrane-anchored protein YejM (alkaline phosphatase superfamily)